MSKESDTKNHIKVCVNVNCCRRGSRQTYEALNRAKGSEYEVVTSEDCFRFCKSGPNVSVNGSVIHGVQAHDAVKRIRHEIQHPSRKKEGIGSRSLDDLDDVLETMFL